MKINYTYSLAEYEAINKARQRRARFAIWGQILFWLLVVLNLGAGLWCITAAWPLNLTEDWIYLGNLAIAILLLAGRYIGGPWYRKWYLRQQDIEGRLVEVEIDEAGIRTNVGSLVSQAAWSDIRSADEEPRHFVIWINRLQAFSIPKTAFPGESDERAFRLLVKDKVRDQDLVK
ncbi:MAG: YcxB family protein [Nitratireductor sp.]